MKKLLTNLNLEKDISCFLIKNNFSIKKIKRIKSGISNKVYFLETYDRKKYVIKYYMTKCNDKLKNELLKSCEINDIKTPKTLIRYVFNNTKIELYEYIDYKNIFWLNQKHINLLLKKINLIDTEMFNVDYKDTIFYKVNRYRQDLGKIKISKLDENIVKIIIEKYDMLRINIQKYKLYLIHGDISLTNLLWNKKDLAVLDFDEAIIAPREYEYVSMLLKLCYKNGKFNYVLCKKIIRKCLNKNNLHQMKEMFDYYILKVLLEKIYLYEIGEIDLYDKNQKKDYWLSWYKLLNNDVLKNKIFLNKWEER